MKEKLLNDLPFGKIITTILLWSNCMITVDNADFIYYVGYIEFHLLFFSKLADLTTCYVVIYN